MKILLTGASGFLGSILKKKLSQKNEVVTLGRSASNDLMVDLSVLSPPLPDFDIIIHAAGKAHVVPKSSIEEAEFFKVNVEGTQNLINGINGLPKLFIFISSVAVYGVEEGELILETQKTLGVSPYSESKIQAEDILTKWSRKTGAKLLILRLPLVVGQKPPGNLGAIIRAIEKGYYFRLGTGDARKSMVLASDIANQILNWQDKEGVYNLTDDYDPKLAELDSYLASQMNAKVRSFPSKLLAILAKVGDLVSVFPLNSYRIKKLKQSLTFSTSKAKEELGWSPNPVIGHFKVKN